VRIGIIPIISYEQTIESPKKLMGDRITNTHKMKPSLGGRSADEDRP
jgi:hypothetical protein